MNIINATIERSTKILSTLSGSGAEGFDPIAMPSKPPTESKPRCIIIITILNKILPPLYSYIKWYMSTGGVVNMIIKI